MAEWLVACTASDLEDEDILRWDHAGQSFAICLLADDSVACVEGTCPRDGAQLAGGLIEGDDILCPMDDCRFDALTGAAADGGPGLRIWPARVNGAVVEVKVG